MRTLPSIAFTNRSLYITEHNISFMHIKRTAKNNITAVKLNTISIPTHIGIKSKATLLQNNNFKIPMYETEEINNSVDLENETICGKTFQSVILYNEANVTCR